jgi:uncharacterized protein YjhX (UPF0386 family)
MPKAKSKAQQRKFFALARKGKITMAQAKAHAKKGKAYKKMPNRLKRKKCDRTVAHRRRADGLDGHRVPGLNREDHLH